MLEYIKSKQLLRIYVPEGGAERDFLISVYLKTIFLDHRNQRARDLQAIEKFSRKEKKSNENKFETKNKNS